MSQDQRITVAFYQDEIQREDAPAVSVEMSWGELVGTLTEDRPAPCTLATCRGKKCQHKSCVGEDRIGAWSPVSLVAARNDRHPTWAVDFWRQDTSVVALHALVLDGDGLTEEQLAEVAQKLSGGSYVAHTTHRHREGAAFIRVAVQLSRPVPAAEWRVFRAAAVELLGLGEIFDPTCKDLSRLYFLPTHPSDAPFSTHVAEGEPLNVDAVLSRSPSIESKQLVTVEKAIVADQEPSIEIDAQQGGFVNMGAIVASLAAYRKSRSHAAKEEDRGKAALIGRLLEGKPLAAPGGNAEPPPIDPPADLTPGRGYAIMRAATICTMYLPKDTPDDAYLEIFSRSLDAMCFGRPSDRLEMEEQLLEKLRIGRDRREQWEAQRAAERERTRSFLSAQAEERERLKKRRETETPPAQDDQQQADDSDDWMVHLRKNAKEDSLLSRSYNAYLILKNESALRGALRWNEVTLQVDASGPFAQAPVASLTTAVANYLDQNWGLSLSTNTVGEQVELVAQEDSYDPIKSYLRSLKWDGEPRVKTWLKVYAGAVLEGSEEWREVMLEEMGRKWMIGAVARGLDPGVKMDLVLILEGKQGARKSSLFEALGGDWYADASIVIGDKDSKMVAARSWICEIPDLAALKKTSEINAIKGFFTVREDTFRPPFGHAVIKSPRRNVYGGTTNDKQFLIDPTGNRRYLCVKCTQIDLPAVIRDRDQLWAEAVALYDRHVRECEDKLNCGCWWFAGQEAEHVETIASDKMGEDATTALIYEWWIGLDPDDRKEYVTTLGVAKDALAHSADKISSGLLSKIAASLEGLGFHEERRRAPDGSRPRIYVPSEALMKLPQSEEGKRRQIKFKPTVLKGGVA